MPDHNFAAAKIATVVAALGVFAILAAALVFQSGRRRAAVVAGLLPLTLLPPVAAQSLAGFELMQLFTGLAASGADAKNLVPRICAELWGAVRLGWGLTALVALAGLLGGWLRFGAARFTPRPCSAPRATALLVAPLLALLLAGLVGTELRAGLGIVRAVMADAGPDQPERRAAVERYLGAHGLDFEGAGAIAPTSRRIAAAAVVASAGGLALLVVLLGLGLSGLIVAWPIQAGTPFAALASLACLLTGVAGALVALGVGAPPVF